MVRAFKLISKLSARPKYQLTSDIFFTKLILNYITKGMDIKDFIEIVI